MRYLFLGILSLISITLKAQDMNNPNATVVGLFVATDQQNWEQVAASFHTEVVLDYSSMNGSPAATLSPQQIVEAWQGVLPGFEHTHHQLGNFITSEDGQTATVFCYGTATHYLPDEQGNVWLVVGSYDFDLVKTESGAWKITTMTFHFKYQDGNQSLPEKAIARAKS
ncbi:MAG: nuclear transport factor 2 family protein [Bacteroidota bacterium]